MAIKSEFEIQLRRVLTRSLEKIDLISREEFDIQTLVLAKTRAKLDKLEQIVSRLERLANAEGDNHDKLS